MPAPFSVEIVASFSSRVLETSSHNNTCNMVHEGEEDFHDDCSELDVFDRLHTSY